MKVSVESINSVQSRISLEIPATQVNEAFLDAYRRIQKKATIQGFRPGKAPLNMIRKLYGAGVSNEVGEKLIQGHLFSAITENNIQPIASPVVEASDIPEQDKAFKFSAVVDTLPKLEFDDYKGLAIESIQYEVPADAVERELKTLQRRSAETKDLDDDTVHAAENHVAIVAHKAYLEGAEIDNMNVDGMSVALGRGELFEGLEKEIFGMKKGETKKAVVALPENYTDADLAGKGVDFEITLKDLKQMVVPELTDEFAKDMNFDDLAALKADIEKHLHNQAEQMGRQHTEGAILEAILAKHAFDVPPAMVDQVIDSMISEMRFPNEEEKKQALSNKAWRDQLLPEAKRRTQNTLILWHVAQNEKIEATEADIEKRIDTTLAGMGLPKDAPQAGKFRAQLAPRIKENLVFEKAMDFLIDNAQVEKSTASV